MSDQISSEAVARKVMQRCAEMRMDGKRLDDNAMQAEVEAFLFLRSGGAKSGFYKTKAWRSLRYQVLRERGRRCECCGCTPKDGREVHVDHIVPRSKSPDLALEKDNLQVLCADCNLGKSNTDSIRWRSV